MAKKSKTPQPTSSFEPSEETVIMNPDSSTRTQAMANAPMEPMDATLILAPGAGDITASGLESGRAGMAAPQDSGETQITDPGPGLPVASEAAPLRVPILISPPEMEEEAPARPFGLWIGLGVGALVLVAAVWYFASEKPSPAATPRAEDQTPLPAPVPIGYQETLRQAQGGDVAAMRTLGAVYAYGLGVPPHRQEGIRWYRKAAEAGSAVAAEEARALEAPVKR